MSVLHEEDLRDLEGLLPHARTHRQREVIREVLAAGSVTAAAEKLGVCKSTVSKVIGFARVHAAKLGYAPEADVNAPVPAGYALRGTSTLYDPDRNVKLQWVKTRVDWDEQLRALEEAVEAFAEGIPAKRPAYARPEAPREDLLALYPEGDPHWGMKVWGPETDGTHYDLKIAQREYYAAIDWLVDRAPEASVGIALNVGDNFHSDRPENVTPRSGHHLNVDSRLGKVFQTVLEARAYKVERMLEKHDRVIVREVYGNHDPVLCLGFTKALVAYYRNEPRVEVVDSPNSWWHYEHGLVMLGTTHGDRCKIKDMPLLMATDAPAVWGRTRFRHCYTGHQHHLERWEEPGCVVEMLRTLAARNEYEHMSGYRSGREMMMRVFHKRYGEVLTHRLGVELVHALLEDDDGEDGEGGR